MGLSSSFARFLLRRAGWEIDGVKPDAPKYVLIAAPHTTNWDLVLMLLAGMAYGVWPSWVGKHTLFKPPLGWLLTPLRGIPVVRGTASNMVDQLANEFAKRESFVLAVPPEGTRSKGRGWKSGFYYIALKAKVPICLGYLDYGTKHAGLGPLLTPTGNVKADMDTIRAFYEEKRGLYPENQSPVQLENEA